MVTVAESLVCPPPPSDSALNEEAISSLIVPAPKWNKVRIWLMMVIRVAQIKKVIVLMTYFLLSDH